jgi:hypothetical protein
MSQIKTGVQFWLFHDEFTIHFFSDAGMPSVTPRFGFAGAFRCTIFVLSYISRNSFCFFAAVGLRLPLSAARAGLASSNSPALHKFFSIPLRCPFMTSTCAHLEVDGFQNTKLVYKFWLFHWNSQFWLFGRRHAFVTPRFRAPFKVYNFRLVCLHFTETRFAFLPSGLLPALNKSRVASSNSPALLKSFLNSQMPP